MFLIPARQWKDCWNCSHNVFIWSHSIHTHLPNSSNHPQTPSFLVFVLVTVDSNLCCSYTCEVRTSIGVWSTSLEPLRKQTLPQKSLTVHSPLINQGVCVYPFSLSPLPSLPSAMGIAGTAFLMGVGELNLSPCA